jgi:hypothetical protein
MKLQPLRTALAAVASILLQACGGAQGLTGPTASTSTSTSTAHSGTYSGVMTYSDDHSTTHAQTTVAQLGSTLTFNELVLAVPAGTKVPLGTATLSGDDFSASTSYTSDGCGRVNLQYQGRFSGSSMHLKVSPSFPSPPAGAACPVFFIEGDLSRP